MERRTPLRRRAQLKTRTPLKAKTRLRAKTALERTGELAARSAKTKAAYALRSPATAAMVARMERCELGAAWRSVGVNCCTGPATCFHERRKRSAGGSIVPQPGSPPSPQLMASCWACNGMVEEQPALARQLGLVLREGDEGWDEAGARHDRLQ